MEWAQTVTAISTAAIALVIFAIVVVAIPQYRQMARFTATMERFLERFERESAPIIESARTVSAEAGQILTTVRGEVDGLVDTSRDLRERIGRATDAAEDRLLELEALVDVVQEEVQETVLDVAAAVRTTRRGTTLFRTMRRAFLGSGKSRKKKRRRRR